MKALIVDVKYCNGCHNCQIACKDEFCDNVWLPYSAKQPTTGHYWMRVDEKERGQVPLVRLSYTPVVCGHCEECPLLALAPEATYRREDGFVIIDPEKAKGNKALVDACPLGAVYWNEEEQLAQKCNGCAHLLDNGWSEPRCVEACPTKALRFGDVETFADILGQTEALEPIDGFNPIVRYLNLPKRFVGGAVVDRIIDEVIIGASVTLLDANDNEVSSVKTDDFGNYLFNQVDAGTYRVRIEADGYETVTLDADLSELDLSLGDQFMVSTGEL